MVERENYSSIRVCVETCNGLRQQVNEWSAREIGESFSWEEMHFGGCH